MMTENDRNKEQKQIIAVSRYSDQSAFNALFRSYGARVYHFSYGYLKSSSEAEEIVQDTFIRIWENRATIDAGNSFSGYIFTIAYHLILNRIRKLRNEMNCKAVLQQTGHTFHNETEEKILHSDLEKRHHAAMVQLPPRRKIIFQMIREEGLTYKQVADHLHISVKTVESQMAEALKHFKKNLS